MTNLSYPAVASFDKYTNDVRVTQISFDSRKQLYDTTIELFDIDERYIFDTENDRLMNLLVPQQFMVRVNDNYYVPESVEYQPTGHVIMHVLLPVDNVRSIAVHVNMLYFEHDGAAWTVPDNIKEAFSDDS
ncbi:hypothetical protein [Alphabaculovirus altersperidaniae]|uniref:Uncharacterized protein n=1 Tax=Spodoptera eridania nucleopolyhedrovirus TaxID=2315721 RepID=A0ABX6TQ75_9ABAC|nr:hypothetical protein QKS47_gp048 [Spodoptera eridania nucleopolyhedrovirus]QNV47868.1 hypothetical protein [Spodoptera eridania nucleopolyhedrovirus]